MSKNRDTSSPAIGDSSSKALESIRCELQELGLRPYAARLLLALLRSGSGTSAQLAELSGVPRTSIYQVMQTFTEQGLVEAGRTHGPAVWTCPGCEAVVDLLDAAEEERVRQHHERTQKLRHELSTVLPARLSA